MRAMTSGARVSFLEGRRALLSGIGTANCGAFRKTADRAVLMTLTGDGEVAIMCDRKASQGSLGICPRLARVSLVSLVLRQRNLRLG